MMSLKGGGGILCRSERGEETWEDRLQDGAGPVEGANDMKVEEVNSVDLKEERGWLVGTGPEKVDGADPAVDSADP